MAGSALSLPLGAAGGRKKESVKQPAAGKRLRITFSPSSVGPASFPDSSRPEIADSIKYVISVVLK